MYHWVSLCAPPWGGGEGRGMHHWVSLCAPPWGGGEGYVPLGQLVCTTLGGRGGVCTTGSACVHHPGGEGRGMYHWVSLCAPPWGGGEGYVPLGQLVCTTLGGRGGVCTTGSACVHHPGGEGRGMHHWVSLCAPPWGGGVCRGHTTSGSW